MKSNIKTTIEHNGSILVYMDTLILGQVAQTVATLREGYGVIEITLDRPWVSKSVVDTDVNRVILHWMCNN